MRPREAREDARRQAKRKLALAESKLLLADFEAGLISREEYRQKRYPEFDSNGDSDAEVGPSRPRKKSRLSSTSKGESDDDGEGSDSDSSSGNGSDSE